LTNSGGTAGQRFEVVAPGSADATAADIAVTFTASIA
jgi:hypothetical protein